MAPMLSGARNLKMVVAGDLFVLVFALLLCCNPVVFSATLPSDTAVLEEFRNGLDNSELLQWPNNSDPCGPPLWPHVYCSGKRVTQIQVQGMGLRGSLPMDFNKLSMLYNIGLQRNNFSGKLPTFKGLSLLQYVYLDYNNFDMIPSDFFEGLTSLQAISLEVNPFNQSTGWVLPNSLASSAQLVNFSCASCNLVGTLPEFLGQMLSLTFLRLSDNRLTGEIPASFCGSNLQILQLNNQAGVGLTGSIDILTSMPSLTDVWLSGNSFSGTIPSNITECASLKTIVLNNNQLTGVIPSSIGALKQLQMFQLYNNKFVGPIPNLSISTYSYDHNSFCQSVPGVPCSPEVDALLDFLGGLNFPLDLAGSWSGNLPCSGLWLGITCISGKVAIVSLPHHNLSGFISPSIGKLDSLVTIRLDRNELSGKIPANLTGLRSLRTINLTSNNLEPPVPSFSKDVTLLINQNPLLKFPSPLNQSAADGPPKASSSSAGGSPPSSTSSPLSSISPSSPKHPMPHSGSYRKGSGTMILLISISAIVVVGTLMTFLVVLCVCRRRMKKERIGIIHPRDLSDATNVVKVVLDDGASKSVTGSNLHSNLRSDTNLIDSENLIKSAHLLRVVTGNFSPKNELGRGGFGVVYKGVLHDGSTIAVKRMENSVLSSTGANEFQSEISVLSKVRHRNLVSLLGYSMDDNEKLLVFEYMPLGTLSQHLFHWRNLSLDPLSWKKRLTIALDVARGMEYLHKLAQHCFIHRDLKPSNILLGDGFLAKVSDFGLVKLAPDGKNSIATRLAGTFGYLAPEYAITGKVTTKVDVYSFGVVLMELVTGLKALDEDRPEETRYLATWFSEIKSSKEELMAVIDQSLCVDEEMFESVSIVAELAGHCVANEPQLRPDMGHAVNVLAPLVEKWHPKNDDDVEENFGIDLQKPLLQMVESWQADCCDSSSRVEESKKSIPSNDFSKPFTSADCR